MLSKAYSIFGTSIRFVCRMKTKKFALNWNNSAKPCILNFIPAQFVYFSILYSIHPAHYKLPVFLCAPHFQFFCVRRQQIRTGSSILGIYNNFGNSTNNLAEVRRCKSNTDKLPSSSLMNGVVIHQTSIWPIQRTFVLTAHTICNTVHVAHDIHENKLFKVNSEL